MQAIKKEFMLVALVVGIALIYIITSLTESACVKEKKSDPLSPKWAPEMPQEVTLPCSNDTYIVKIEFEYYHKSNEDQDWVGGELKVKGGKVIDWDSLMVPSDPDKGTITRELKVWCDLDCNVCGRGKKGEDPPQCTNGPSAVLEGRVRFNVKGLVQDKGQNYEQPKATITVKCDPEIGAARENTQRYVYCSFQDGYPLGNVDIPVYISPYLADILDSVSFLTLAINFPDGVTPLSVEPDSFFASYFDSMDFSISGDTVSIFGLNGNSIPLDTLVNGIRMVKITAYVEPATPLLELQPVLIDTLSSGFFDSLGSPMDTIDWIDGGVFVAPYDTIPPGIDSLKVTFGEFLIIGDSGAVWDNNDTIAGWVGVGLEEMDVDSLGDTLWYGVEWTLIDSLGGFTLIQPMYIDSFFVLRLVAEDFWGNADTLILVNAPESTFTIICSPYIAYATPGDPPAALYTVDVGSIAGYNENVDLECSPPAGINVAFNPPSGIPPFTSDVYVSVNPGTPYDDYTLTFCGTGADGQGPKCCDVTLRVQSYYNEGVVPFYHGMQRVSNYGAIGNDDSTENFVWYDTNYLYDGTIISAVPVEPYSEHMALDVYNCEHVGFIPTEHLDVYYDPDHNANIAYANFYTEEDVISCEYDSLFVVGIMDSCIDFSLKIKIYYNPTGTPIPELYAGMFEDWNVGDSYNNAANMDPDHNLMWMYDPLDPHLVFGMMKAPFYDDPMYNMTVVRNPQYVYPNNGFCSGWGLDSLYYLMTRPGYFNHVAPDTDLSLLMVPPPFSLNPGEKHLEVWIDFGRDLSDGLTWPQWWSRVLRYAGFYRGDVNAPDTGEVQMPNIADVVYLINYLFINGPAPVPYADQGDLNADRVTNIADVVYLLNFIFTGGAPPIDYVRFIPSMWSRPSLFFNPLWQ